MAGNRANRIPLSSSPTRISSLVDHLRNVGQLSRKTVADKSLNIDEADLLKMRHTLLASHMTSEGHEFFQKYIIEKDEKKKKSLKAKETTHHGLLSAFFTYAVIKEYLSQSG